MNGFREENKTLVWERDHETILIQPWERIVSGTVIETLEKAGLKNKVKVMIGGAPVSRAYADEIGAEGFAEDCASAVDEAARL
ncbi:unnamed protein product, partial [marine sediment metagenome]